MKDSQPPTEALDASQQDGSPTTDTVLRRRPEWIASVALDATFGTACYLVSYWLRFTGGEFRDFLPGARATLPLVVITQIAGLFLFRAYAHRPRIDWIFRVVVGVGAGTAAAAAAVLFTLGFTGVSRGAFAADAVLLTIAALGWRGVWVLRLRARLRATAVAAGGDLVDRAAEMTTVRGIATSLYSYRELLRNLVFKDLKLKYRGSIFGFLWSLLNPLMMIMVYAFAFTYIMGVRGQGFVFYLMLGQLAWTFFANSAMMSTGAVVDNAGLLKSVLFPRAILPIGTVLFNFAQYLLTIAVFLPLMLLWYRIPPSPEMALYPMFLALQVVFTVGFALIMSTATAFFRDVRHLLEIAIQVLFWMTPIVYEYRQIPEQARLLVLLNPMSSYVIAYQDIFYFHQWPEPTIWVMAWVHAVGALVIGALLFLSFEDGFTEQL